MHNDLIIHFANARQDEIARTTAHRQTLRSLVGRRSRRPGRQLIGWPLPGSGMLPAWRHGSPAHGS